jgi:hypothetical protein
MTIQEMQNKYDDLKEEAKKAKEAGDKVRCKILLYDARGQKRRIDSLIKKGLTKQQLPKTGFFREHMDELERLTK